MEHLPVCGACGLPYEHHRPVGVSADGRKKQITCVMDRDGNVRPDQRMYVQSLLQRAFQRQLGGNDRTFVDKLEFEAVKKALEEEQRNIVLLAEEHRVELDKANEERRLIEEELRKAEARVRELEKKVLVQKTDLIDTGRKLIVARDTLAPVQAENAKVRARNIELERLNATLEERLKHPKPNGTPVKLPFSTLEDSAPSTPNDKETA